MIFRRKAIYEELHPETKRRECRHRGALECNGKLGYCIQNGPQLGSSSQVAHSAGVANFATLDVRPVTAGRSTQTARRKAIHSEGNGGNWVK